MEGAVIGKFVCLSSAIILQCLHTHLVRGFFVSIDGEE